MVGHSVAMAGRPPSGGSQCPAVLQASRSCEPPEQSPPPSRCVRAAATSLQPPYMLVALLPLLRCGCLLAPLVVGLQMIHTRREDASCIGAAHGGGWQALMVGIDDVKEGTYEIDHASVL
ncbi:hypothetical protein ZWY2020_041394 [Hordeum vulgare]|nr:hypothetical protein ZWY2020_041394 [Hordeum vulgare]